MAKILARCPVCEAALGISELACTQCQTHIHGSFDPCRFCRLAPEHLNFVELFLRCEGNLSRVGEELGISYPTVRNRLSAALVALGFAGGPDGVAAGEERAFPPFPPPPALPVRPEVTARRLEVLDALARGEMSAEEAAGALRELTP
jgi:hypothetical protein